MLIFFFKEVILFRNDVVTNWEFVFHLRVYYIMLYDIFQDFCLDSEMGIFGYVLVMSWDGMWR